jgi:uncharacterized membrane protein YwzB
MSSTMRRRIFSLSPEAFDAGITDPDIDIYPDVLIILVIIWALATLTYSQIVDKQRSTNYLKQKSLLLAG